MALDGVVSAHVSYEEERADIRYRQNRTNPDAMILAIDLIGFSAKQCSTTGCRFVGQRVNQAFLMLGTIVVVTSLLLRVFPAWTSRILQAITG